MASFDVVDATFKNIVKSALTEKLIEADRARDELFFVLAGVVKACRGKKARPPTGTRLYLCETFLALTSRPAA